MPVRFNVALRTDTLKNFFVKMVTTPGPTALRTVLKICVFRRAFYLSPTGRVGAPSFTENEKVP